MASCDPDADGSVRSLAILRGARPECPDQALGDTPRDRHLGGIPEEHRELVATDPGGDVARSQCRLDPLANGRQERVAGGMAQGVIDDLEVI